MKSIIELAKSAGLYVGTNISGVTLVGGSPSNNKLIVHLDIEEMERFAALVRAEVLEEAAGVCEEVHDRYPTDIFPDGQSVDAQSAKMARITANNCAAAIRALKTGGAT
jgi:hypothetical protein